MENNAKEIIQDHCEYIWLKEFVGTLTDTINAYNDFLDWMEANPINEN